MKKHRKISIAQVENAFWMLNSTRTSFLDNMHDENYVLLVINFIEVCYYAIVIELDSWSHKSSYDKQVCMELWGSANMISTFTSVTFRKSFWN